MLLANERRSLLLLFLVGLGLMLLNYVLIRQMVASFADLETSALLMTLAYFTGVSLGYLRPERVTPHVVRTVLPILLVFQLVLAALGPLLTHLLVERVGRAPTYAVVFVATALGSTSLFSVFLPNAVGPEAEGSRMGRHYSAEVAGSIVGILLLFVLARAGMVAVQAAYLATFLGIAVLADVRPRALVAMATIATAFLLASGPIERWVLGTIYKASLAGGRPVQVLWSRHSPYQRVDVVAVEGAGRVLLLDGQVHFDASMHDTYSYFVAEYPARLLGRPAVCVLGCGSMSTVGRMGEGVASIRIVDLDEEVFAASRAFFGDFNRLGTLSNWTFQGDDAKHFLATTAETFDLVVDDVPPAHTRQIALLYTREFLALVRARLSPRGMLSLPTLIPVTSQHRAYGRRILATLIASFEQVYVLTVGGSSYCLATGRSLALDEGTLRRAIDHPARDETRILLPDEARRLVEGVRPITINDMADLVHE